MAVELWLGTDRCTDKQTGRQIDGHTDARMVEQTKKAT